MASTISSSAPFYYGEIPPEYLRLLKDETKSVPYSNSVQIDIGATRSDLCLLTVPTGKVFFCTSIASVQNTAADDFYGVYDSTTTAATLRAIVPVAASLSYTGLPAYTVPRVFQSGIFAKLTDLSHNTGWLYVFIEGYMVDV